MAATAAAMAAAAVAAAAAALEKEKHPETASVRQLARQSHRIATQQSSQSSTLGTARGPVQAGRPVPEEKTSAEAVAAAAAAAAAAAEAEGEEEEAVADD